MSIRTSTYKLYQGFIDVISNSETAKVKSVKSQNKRFAV